MFYISIKGDVGLDNVIDKLNVRPSVCLKSNVRITSGDGTCASPYVLSI